MQRLTVAGRLIITALVVAAFYFGFSKLGGQELLKKLKTTDSTQTTSTTSSTLPAEDKSSDEASSNSNDEAVDSAKPSFDYTAPVPIAGKLKVW